MKRRNFIKTGGAALASASVFGINPGVIGSNNIINIGVIGTGDRGSGLIPFLNQIEGVKVHSCCDILPFRLENGLKRAGSGAIGFSDYRSMLDNKDLDAILVSTPFSTHSAIAIDAIDAGKHVYCEKTLAKGYKGIAALIKKAESQKRIVQTGHQYHSSRLYTEVVKMIREGKVGRITAFECQWNRNGNWRRSVPEPGLERAINWRMYREYSGGLMAELCSHQIDFVNWVTRSVPVKVMGMGGVDYWKDGRETYDNVHVLMEYPEGIKASFTCLTSNAKDDYLIKVFGDKGTIILDYTKAWFYPEGQYDKNKALGDVDGVSGATITADWVQGRGIPLEIDHIDPSKQALLDFRDNILNNTRPMSDVITGSEAAIAVQMGLDAMYNDSIIYRKEISIL